MNGFSMWTHLALFFAQQMARVDSLVLGRTSNKQSTRTKGAVVGCVNPMMVGLVLHLRMMQIERQRKHNETKRNPYIQLATQSRKEATPFGQQCVQHGQSISRHSAYKAVNRLESKSQNGMLPVNLFVNTRNRISEDKERICVGIVPVS